MVRVSRRVTVSALAAVLCAGLARTGRAQGALETQAAFAAKDFDLSGLKGAAPSGGDAVDAASVARDMAAARPKGGSPVIRMAGTRNLAVHVPSPAFAEKAKGAWSAAKWLAPTAIGAGGGGLAGAAIAGPIGAGVGAAIGAVAGLAVTAGMAAVKAAYWFADRM